jgi:hypothetical protein
MQDLNLSIESFINKFKLQKNKSQLLSNPNLKLFDQGSKQLWYNWSNSIGNNYVALSYSAGSTQIIYNDLSLQKPIIKIFNKKTIEFTEENEPLFTIECNELEGIRSLLLIDNYENPFLLIGSFSYTQNESYIYYLDILTQNLKKIYKFNDSNSVRTMINYNNTIYIATQNDLNNDINSTIYYIKIKDICKKNIKSTNFIYNNEYIKGSIWSFYMDENKIYISIPIKEEDENKLSGFSIKGRLFVTDICSLKKNVVK